jgi:hypothetical protein
MKPTAPTFADDLRQMLADWDQATPEQREAALAVAASAAARALGRLGGSANSPAQLAHRKTLHLSSPKSGRQPGQGHIPDLTRARKPGAARGFALCGKYVWFRAGVGPGCPTCLWLRSTLRKG